MNKIVLFLIAISIGLSVKADDTIQTDQSIYPAQPLDYSTIPAYSQLYNNQGYYQNPYQTQYPRPYINPYQYRMPYIGGTSILNSSLLGTGSTGGAQQIIKSLGRSILYSMMRGY